MAPGSFTALLGRSGSGKTTLLRTLAGLDPAEGAAVPRPTAVVFQEVGLARHAGAWPLTLSGGEAGRVALKALFAPRGVAVSWVEFPAGPLLLEALNAGAIDFSATGDTPPIFAQAAGADLLYVGAQPVRVDNQAIIVRDGGRSTTWRACVAAGWPKPAGPARTTWWCKLPIWRRATASSWPAVAGRCNRRTRSRCCWTRSTAPPPGRGAHPDDLAGMMAEVTGVPLDVQRVAAPRGVYAARPMDAGIVAQQQEGADTFARLRIIPAPIDVRRIVWTPPAT